MTFHSIVRKWCRIYKPMLDSGTNGNRRFYLTDSTDGVVELAKGIEGLLSPCVVMESSVEGGGTFSQVSRNYPVYFFVKAEKMADGDAAALAKEEAWMHARNFLSWLHLMREKEIEECTDRGFRYINLDTTGLDVTTVGPLENGWYAVLIQFERTEPLDRCIDDNLYVDMDNC